MKTQKTLRIGVLGCGYVAPSYLMASQAATGLEMIACADLDFGRARSFAARHGLRPMTVTELLESDVELILNLTPPSQHAGLSLGALEAGKHVYSEKPLALTLEEAQVIRTSAERNGLRVGCAPDTFLGPAWQGIRSILERDLIGQASSVICTFLDPGVELWSAAPEGFYRSDAGPLLDWGPYPITVLIALLGAVKAVTAVGRISERDRTAWDGRRVPVDCLTHVSATLEFVSGVIGSLIISADVQRTSLPHFELHGTRGTLVGPDPMLHFGLVRYITRDSKLRTHPPQSIPNIPRPAHPLRQLLSGRVSPISRWKPVPTVSSPHLQRGCGLVEMVNAILDENPHRASLELATHVLEVLLAIRTSAKDGTSVRLESTFTGEGHSAWKGRGDRA